MLGQKPRLILLNKCDVADPNLTARWCEYYRSKGILAIPTDCKSGRGLNEIIPGARQVLDEVMKRREAKGLSQKLLRMMIVGIPNVGKSSLINKLAGSKRAKVEDRPGVTRGKQWVSIGGGVELLDMPGVLWPKFDDKEVGEKLAYIGSIKDEILDIEHLAMRFLQTVAENYPKLLCARYNLTPEEIEGKDGFDLLELVGRKRGMLQSGGVVNTERAAIMLLDEFRGGKLGRITLEKPPKFTPAAREQEQDDAE